MSNGDAVRKMFDAYRSQDRAAAEALIADDLVFTSPQDDHIDRATYFERCFPTAERFVSQTTLALVDFGADDVFVLYEYELASGEVHRNTEFITVREGQVHEIQVFFGGRVR